MPRPKSELLTFVSPAVAESIAKLKKQGKRVVHCHGVFDLLHPGHVDHLREAKSLGDVLVVSVTSDRFVNKGPGRPIFSVDLRLKMLDALECVDFTFESPGATAEEAIEAVRPDLFVKGPDYGNFDTDITGNIRRELDAVEKAGGQLAFTAGPTMSSSKLINQRGLLHSDHAQAWLEDVRQEFHDDTISSWLAKIRDLKVLVVGELILDDYVFCDALGKTSKEPVLAFLMGSHERQMGGSLAIAKHCRGLGAQTTLLTRLGNDDAGRDARASIETTGLHLVAQTSDSHRTIVKTRYLDEATGTKVFETYSMTDEPAAGPDDVAFAQLLSDEIMFADLVLVADYGHGLMTETAIAALSRAPGVVAVNTQSNAGNRGFNSISRYPRLDIVSLNGGELALELRDKDVDVVGILPALGERTGARWIVVTEGAKGMALWNRGSPVSEMPAFTESVKDRVGAGDALFAAVSLLLAMGAPGPVVGLLGNLAGAAMVSDLGNRYSLSAIDLQRHAEALLK